jgi:hypothetical protein
MIPGHVAHQLEKHGVQILVQMHTAYWKVGWPPPLCLCCQFGWRFHSVQQRQLSQTLSFGKSCGRGMVKTCSKIGSRRQVPKPKKLWSWSRLGKLIPIGVQHGATNVGMFGCRWGRQAQHGLARTLIKAVGNSNERIFSVCRVESAKLATSKTPNLGPQVALCWTQLSWSPSCQPIGHVGLQLGPNRPRWAPNSSHVMHMEVQVTPKVAHLGTFWRQFHTDT